MHKVISPCALHEDMWGNSSHTANPRKALPLIVQKWDKIFS